MCISPPALGEPSVEVPIDDLVAFVTHVAMERRARALVEQTHGNR